MERLSVAPLSAAEEAAFAAIRPAEERPLDCARFVLGGLVALEFGRHEVTRLAGGFGWAGYLRERGFNPAHAFDRHYRDGSMVVALWCGTGQIGRPS
jgi:hypothetical protein